MAVFTNLHHEENKSPNGNLIVKDVLLDPELFQNANSLFAKITLHPGCEVPYHQHLKNFETYYLLQGEGEYNDGGKISRVKAGDVTFCADGASHGIKNDGKEDLVFVALITNTPGYWK